MAVIEVKESWGGRAWRDSEGLGCERLFTVTTDEWDSEVIARAADGIPQKGKKHPDDPNLVVDSNSASRKGNAMVFIVTVEYRTGDARLGGSDAVHPLKRPVQESIGETSMMVPVDYAVDGPNTRKTMRILKAAGIGVQETETIYRGGLPVKVRSVKCPIVNTAGSVPDPKAMVETAVPVLTLTKNVKEYDKSIYLPYWNTLNRSTFRGMPAGTVLMRSILGDPREEEVNGKSYEYVTLIHNILIQPWGWDWRMKNEGRVAYNSEIREWIVLRDEKTGTPYGEPMMLDRKGMIADPGAKPIWLYFDLLEEASWAKLNIG